VYSEVPVQADTEDVIVDAGYFPNASFAALVVPVQQTLLPQINSVQLTGAGAHHCMAATPNN